MISQTGGQQGWFYVGVGEACATPDHLLPTDPQIQKLAGRSDMISEVPKCSKIQIFQGSAPYPAGGAYSAPPDPLADREGLAAPSQEPHPRSRPFDPRFYGSQGLTNYRVGNPNNDRFQMMFVFFSV